MNEIIVEKLRGLKNGIYAEVKKKIDKIESIATNFGHTNLKIHDVSYYLYQAVQSGLITDAQSLSTFQHLAEMEYDQFTDWEAENLNYVKREYIGRTSSFYYQSNWYGSYIDNYVLQQLLEGKDVLMDSLKGLYSGVYDYLMSDIYNHDEFENTVKDDIEDFFEGEENYLDELNDELDIVLEIVNEAKKAYDYLTEYKTEENERILAKEYLEHEISEYYAEDKAKSLYEEIIWNVVEKLNTVETLKVNYKINEETKKYDLLVTINGNEAVINTEIGSEHELSEMCIKSVISYLEEVISDNFELVQ